MKTKLLALLFCFLVQLPTPTAGAGAEKLERLKYADDIRLEGVALEADKLVVVTSQAAIAGSDVTHDEMLAFMAFTPHLA